MHQVQRVAVRDPRSGGEGRWRTVDEGDLEVHAGKFEIPYGSIVPRPGEVSNLLVPTCIASTHLAYGAYRLESPYMVVGHSAGVAAFLALAEQVAVQSINVSQLASLLRVAAFLRARGACWGGRSPFRARHAQRLRQPPTRWTRGERTFLWARPPTSSRR